MYMDAQAHVLEVDHALAGSAGHKRDPPRMTEAVVRLHRTVKMGLEKMRVQYMDVYG